MLAWLHETPVQPSVSIGRGSLPTLVEAPVRAVEWRRRLGLALLCGVVAAAVTAQSNANKPWPRDFAQVWFAARAVLHGQDPYAMIGPSRAYEWAATFFYPLPAALLATPFAPLSQEAATVAFSAIGGACFAWALMRYGYAPLVGFVSASAHFAFENAQWSPLLAASVVVSPLAIVLVAKPTIGAAMFAARPSWWAVGGGAVLLALAFVVEPQWLSHWRASLQMTSLTAAGGFPYRAPIAFPGGVLALACLIRWRLPEARLVAVLACVPQTLMLYEAVPLCLVPRTFRESAALVALSYLVAYYLTEAKVPGTDIATYLESSARAMVLVLYPAVTIMVLRRPNVGPAPAWIERVVARWPAWLRGADA